MKQAFRIRELCQTANMTQRELATQIGYKTESAIAMWESGERKPPSDLLPQLTSQDDACSETAMLDICRRVAEQTLKLQANSQRLLMEDIAAARKAVGARSAWRVEGTLREFPKFPPVNLWFDYPIHRMDFVGVLKDIKPEAERG